MGLRRGAPDARERFAAYWAQDGAGHFAIEERVLTAGLLPEEARWPEGVARMTAEHRDLERLAALALGGDQEAQAQLGERLDAHVRFEERELFPLLEEHADPALLAGVGAALAERR